jgi:hypothetical protein
LKDGRYAAKENVLKTMTPEEKIAKDLLFIAPYDYEGLSGWLVKISWYPSDRYESRKWHSKLNYPPTRYL